MPQRYTLPYLYSVKSRLPTTISWVALLEAHPRKQVRQLRRRLSCEASMFLGPLHQALLLGRTTVTGDVVAKKEHLRGRLQHRQS